MRRNFIRITIFLILILFGGFLFSPNVFAQDYTVKSVIIIPPDWQGKLDKQELDNYKSGIVNGLNAVRLLYANLLNGKTFTFDRNIEVVASKDPIDKVEEKLMLDRDYRSSFNTNVFPLRKGVVYIAWGIGTKNGVRRGDPVSKDFGFVWLKQQDIISLSGSGTDDERKWSLVMVAHELGHAFGLVFAGYADGHPCTEESSQECSANAPRPYPGPYEWASIMGYGTPYLSFPNLFFNNSVYNPEIQKIFKSPFINPNADPAPSPTASQAGQKQQGPVFFELIPGTIIAGQNFAIKGINLEKFREFEIRRKDLANPSNKDRLQNVKMLDNNGSTIRINVAEDAVPGNSDSNWEIKLLDKSGSLTIPVELSIKGKDAAGGVILAADITATCGPDKKQVQSATVRLQDRNGAILASANTQPDGTAILNYTIENPQPGNQYNLVADEIQGITPTSDSPGSAGSNSKTITAADSSFNTSASFDYPECPQICNPKITFLCGGISDAISFPKGHTIKITPNCTNTNMYGEGLGSKEDLGDRGECAEGVVVPNVTAGLPTATERVSSRGTVDQPLTGQGSQAAPVADTSGTYTALTADTLVEGTKVWISNYADFREVNMDGDFGSPTITVDPSSRVTWTLNTLRSEDDKQVSVMIRKPDQDINEAEKIPYFKSDGGIIEVAGVIIKTETVKNFVTKNIITVNGVRHELNAGNPRIAVRLDGTEGSPQAFNLPYEIYYAERSQPIIDYLPINYQPPRECECTFANPCTTASGEPGAQECRGIWEQTADGKQCKYDKSGDCTIQCKTCVAGATPEPLATLEPIPTPTTTPPDCGTPEFKYNECTGCNTSHPVYQDGCGNYSTGPDQSDGACTDGCAVTPTPPPDCGTPQFKYNECVACNTSHPVYQDGCGNYSTGPDQSDGACTDGCAVTPTPPPDCGTPQFQYNQCIACNISQPIYQDSCGNYTTGPDQSDGACADWCAATPPPAPNCGTPEFKYNQCIACNTSQPVYQDSCGNYTTGNNQSDGACTDGCNATSPPAPDCGTPQFKYNECVGCNTSHPVYQDNCGNYTTGSDQSDGACTDGCTAPGGPPPAPSIAVNEGCITNGYSGSGFNFSWSGTNITYIDVSTDNFNSFYNKYVAGATSTSGDGFNAYQNASGTLTYSPGTTYQVRVYDGSQHSGSSQFRAPDACAGCGTPEFKYNQCIACNTSQPVYQDSCGNYTTGPDQSDGACTDGCAAPPPPPPPTGCQNPPGSPWVWTGDGLGYVCGNGGQDICAANGMGDACVGVPYVCENGQWKSLNDSGECTTVCGTDSGMCY